MSDRAVGDLSQSLPSDYKPIIFEKFEGLNTKSPRQAIQDTQMAWCDGFMPWGSDLRILPGVGDAAFTASGGSIAWFGFGNIADTAYGVALLTDGSVHAFDMGGVDTTIMAAGTISAPSSFFGFSQWGSKYLIFSKDQTNGYWLWDSANLFAAGSLGPEVIIDNAGKNYLSVPTVTLQTTGSGVGASFSAVIENGSVTKITVTDPGSNFQVDDFVTLNITGGGTDDQAVLAVVPTTTSGGVDQVIIVDGGTQYTYRAQVVFSGGAGSGASAVPSITNGVITAIAIVSPGTGYTSAPTVSITDPGIPGSVAIPGGSGFSGHCSIALGQITSVGVTSGGTGYVAAPALKIVGDGTGASGIIQIDDTGIIQAVVMQNYGKGYTKALAIALGGNDAANATPEAMPFGISGTSIEVYADRVWVTNGAAVSNAPPKNRTIFSSSQSPVNFGDNGGAFGSNDSFLRVGYHGLKQSNGFLYLIGDSSINAISGVQTTSASATGVAAAATTTFSNQNVDPQLGTPWAASVQLFSRNIIFANTLGIFVLSGGAATRISEPLDGFYGSGVVIGPLNNFSSAVANIFNAPVFMFLMPIIDPITGGIVNKLLMWDGRKWFTSTQNKTLTFIATQELNSVLTAWGTDGASIFPLFNTPANFTKIVQSKLFSSPLYWTTKTALHLHGVVSGFSGADNLAVSLDNENGTGTGNAAVSLTESGALVVFGPEPVGQIGRMIGITLQTTASDGAITSLGLSEILETVNA